MKIGIFGGSFDPPHLGHIAIAKLSIKKFELDKLIIIPVGIPPHKINGLSESKHRYAMSMAVADKYGFEISDYEIKKDCISYTADTIEYFAGLYKYDELFFIAGGDSIDYMGKWKEPDRIFNNCSIIAAGRKGSKKEKEKELEIKYNAKIYWLDNDNIDISSTQIRDIVKNEGDISDFVIEEIGQYIKQNNLYR